MVSITNGTTNKVVTKGAYENFYKPLGYEIIVDTNNKKREVEVKEEVKKETKKEIKEEKDNVDKGEKKSQKIEEFKKR